MYDNIANPLVKGKFMAKAKKGAALDEETQQGQDDEFTGDTSGDEKLTPEQKRERFNQIYGYYPEDEVPAQRFHRLGAGRVSRIIDGLRTLPALGNRKSYEYTEEQANRMFERIESELREARAQFTRVAIEGITRPRSFSFD